MYNQNTDRVCRLLDGYLDEDQLKEIDSLLRSDPDFAETLQVLTSFEVLLRRTAHEKASVVQGPGTIRPARRGAAHLRLRSRRGSKVRSALWIATAAAVLIGVCTSFLVTDTSERAGAVRVAKAPVRVEVTDTYTDTETDTDTDTDTIRVTEDEKKTRTDTDLVTEVEKAADAAVVTVERTAPAPQSEPVEEPARVSSTTTIAVVASLESFEGEVVICQGTSESAVPGARMGLGEGQGIRTRGAGSGAVIRFPDGSRVTLFEETFVSGITASNGKCVILEHGTLHGDIGKQANDHPMRLITPHGQAQVLGTRFILQARDHESRLDVAEGRVRMTRASDSASVIVNSGECTVVSGDQKLATRSTRGADLKLAALYDFKEGKGGLVRDSVKPALNLRIENGQGVRWIEDGLQVQSATRISSIAPASKITEACKRSNELTVEAWIRPSALRTVHDPDPGRILTLSKDPYNRNFTLEQREPGSSGAVECYNLRLRTSRTNENGWPPSFTSPQKMFGTRLTHVVYTREASGAATLYMDGIAVTKGFMPGDLSTWQSDYHLGLGDEFGGGRAWLGEYHLLAIYSKALTAEDVALLKRLGAE